MESLIIFIVICFIALLVASLFKTKRVENYNYVSRGNLLTPAELNFYRNMKNYLPQGLSIMSKVRLWDILSADSDGYKNGAVNRIKQKHVDFVIIDDLTSAIKMIIELNDSSHQNEDRVDRDIFLKQALEGAGLKLIVVKPKNSYAAEDFGFFSNNLNS